MTEKFTRFSFWAQQWIKLFAHPVNPFDYFTREELKEICQQVIRDAVKEEACKLCVLHNLSYAEAEYIVVSQLVEG